MMRKVLYICVAAAAVVMAGCKTECTDCVFESVVPTTAQRAFLLYLATDNSLSSMGTGNLNALSRGATAASLGSGVMFVLQDIPKTNTKLVAIYIDPATGQKQQKTVKTYSTNLDTSLPKTLTDVWSDIQKITTANEWVVSFGSHGNGWFPGTRSTRAVQGIAPLTPLMSRPNSGGAGTRSLLEDQGNVMGPDEFAAAMPKVDMIIMDACDMGGVEFAYLLKDKAKYLVLSPAEVIDNGFPYDQIVGDLFNADMLAGARGVCEKFYNFYDNYTYTNARYATVSLFDTSKFDAYTAAMKTALSGKKAQIEALTADDIAGIKTFDRSGFVVSETPYRAVTTSVMYDMKEYLTYLGVWSAVEAAQQDLIVYHNTTGKAFTADNGPDIVIEKERFSGVSTYIPANAESFANADVKQVRQNLNAYWLHTAWAEELWK